MTSTATPGTGETTYNPICNATAEFPLNLNSYRNTLRRDPCQIAGSLLASEECATFGNVTETARMLRNVIEAQDPTAMVPEQKNQCFCTSPVYALVSFCRSCQRSSNRSPPVFADWPTWISPCAVPFSDDFIPISASLLEQERVMKWANDTNVFDEKGTFSLERLKYRVEVEQDPFDTSEFSPSEGTLPAGDGDSSSPGTSGGGGGSSNSNPGAQSASRKTLVGPIVGGVIGGVVLLLSLGLLFLFLRRRRKGTKEAPSAAYIRACGGQLPANVATPYVAGNRESTQYPNEKVILAEREKNMESVNVNIPTPIRMDSTETSPSESGSFDPYLISETDRLQTVPSRSGPRG